MDLLLFLLAFVIGFGLFISSAYFLAKWMFPRLEGEDDFNFRNAARRNIHMPRISKHNPYSFK
jgi:hypothetical protein